MKCAYTTSTVASLLDILQTTPSPTVRVDHATGDSFINDILPDDDHETVLEKVGVWYFNMVTFCVLKQSHIILASGARC